MTETKKRDSGVSIFLSVWQPRVHIRRFQIDQKKANSAQISLLREICAIFAVFFLFIIIKIKKISPETRIICPTSKRSPCNLKPSIFWPFCTFWTRVAITAPRRPKRTKPGSKAVWVLGNQPVAGFARRFGRLARQHVRCGAHMCPFQGPKSALGARSYIWDQARFAANIRAQTMLWV